MPSRRDTLRWAAAGLLAAGLVPVATLTGCGFELRRPATMPFTRLALTGFKPRSPLEAELRRSLPDKVAVMPLPKDAEVVLAVQDDRFEKTVAASTAVGEVREFRLRQTLRFKLTRPDGSVLLPLTEIERSRDMTYTETAALAKETEEAGLVQEMRADIVQQLLRMLSAAAMNA